MTRTFPVAFDESKAAGGTPAAWTDWMNQDQMLVSTGGALNTSFSANSVFNMANGLLSWMS